MIQPNCKTCIGHKLCQSNSWAWFYFFIGILATISIRVVNFIFNYNPLWGKVAWYIGIIGFFIYFFYKFNMDLNLKKQLKKLELSDKIQNCQDLLIDDYRFLNILLCQIRSKKDMINYFFIFLSSGLALIVGVYQDLIQNIK